MTDLPVSVVIVSRGRAEALTRCLTGVAQVQYPQFEVVVVADPAGIAAAEALPFAADLKCVPFDRANISAARNLGIAHAAGEVVAFIDDDAVPEPLWLHHLTSPAAQADMAAMGGPVRGRNGISFQWQAQVLDAEGGTQPLELHPRRASVLHPPPGRAVKTEGTNMAVRRDVLVALGGFDEAFHYFLDETDLNLRLARAGHATALVPLAEVHHGFAANALRRADRVPRDLFDIGASWAVFQRRHLPVARHADHWADLRAAQRRRLLRHLQRGGLDPLDVHRLMRRLDAGRAEGLLRHEAPAALPRHPVEGFRRFPAQARPSVVMLTRPARLRRDRAAAQARVAAGEIVTLLNLSPTALYHRVQFTTAGVWEQHGGLYGRSDRDAPLFAFWRRGARAKAETARVALQRGLADPEAALAE